MAARFPSRIGGRGKSSHGGSSSHGGPPPGGAAAVHGSPKFLYPHLEWDDDEFSMSHGGASSAAGMVGGRRCNVSPPVDVVQCRMHSISVLRIGKAPGNVFEKKVASYLLIGSARL